MAEKSSKPYLIRAIHEWCTDSNLTPYLSVKVNTETRVPREFVKDGEIVLNLASHSTHRLTIGEDLIQFAARFGGQSRECSIPMGAVSGIFARESGQGMFFQPDEVAVADNGATAAKPEAPADPDTPTPSPTPKRPRLQIIK
jgi:stringent starvation protein B